MKKTSEFITKNNKTFQVYLDGKRRVLIETTQSAINRGVPVERIPPGVSGKDHYKDSKPNLKQAA